MPNPQQITALRIGLSNPYGAHTSLLVSRQSFHSTYIHSTASNPTLVNSTMGVDHRVPSILKSEIGWNTGVGKNWSV